LRQRVVAERIASSGARAVGDSPDGFARRIAAERAMWGAIIKAANITPQ
jgi:tripartite-type tricarboxylate transporter receptor subunit TctC